MRNFPPTWRTRPHAFAAFFLAVFAIAQPAQSQTAPLWPPRWTVVAGVESLWWRDVARSGPPVEASPVSWEGSGPIFLIAHDRGGRARLHHYEASFTTAGNFELRSPVQSRAAGGDGASRLSGGYEYRRYPWRDLWITGFDVGVGGAASAERLLFDRHFAPGIELQRRLNTLGSAALIAVRWQRSERWSLHAVWANGVTIGKSNLRYRSDSEAISQSWGGGWQTNFDLRGDARIAPHVRLTAGWFNSGEGRFESHDGHTYGRSRFTVGVRYDR